MISPKEKTLGKSNCCDAEVMPPRGEAVGEAFGVCQKCGQLLRDNRPSERPNRSSEKPISRWTRSDGKTVFDWIGDIIIYIIVWGGIGAFFLYCG